MQKSILSKKMPKETEDKLEAYLNSEYDENKAFQCISEPYDGVKYFTKQELMDAVKELKEKHKQDLDSDFNPFDGLELL